MNFLWFIVGISLPTFIGWLLIRILEWKTPVLFRLERWVLGFALGLTFTMFVTFLVHVTTSLPLSRIGYVLIQLTLILLLGIIYKKLRIKKIKSQMSTDCQLPVLSEVEGSIVNCQFPKWARIAILILIIWTITKILATSITFSLLTPPYLDDTVDNWNFRGKLFFVNQSIVLEIPDVEGNPVPGDVSIYPPAVPLAKAELASLAGKWSEPLANSVNFLWFLSVLALLFFALKRYVSVLWALLGIYILVSLPLYLLHGTNPYSDVFLSMHVFAAISLIYHASTTDDHDRRRSFLRLGAFATALLPFTKAEALFLHVPPTLLILLIALWWKKRSGEMSFKETMQTVLWYAIFLAAIALPWIIFKWQNDLAFGNAKAISGLSVAWQPGVLKSVAINTFMEGNWLLLFPLLILLLIVKRNIAFKTPLVILTGFFLIILIGQLILYMFTYLSLEALYQTGYARGLIQLAPVVVMLVILLLAKCVRVNNSTVLSTSSE